MALGEDAATDSEIEDIPATQPAPTVSVQHAVEEPTCEVCLVQPPQARLALVPCGHHGFCDTCINAVYEQRRGCPVCRTPINMILRLY